MTRERAFILPMMIVLTLVVGILTVTLLERQASNRHAIERQLDGYQKHHLGRGMQEVVGAWIQNLGSAGESEMVDEQGRAFTLRLDDGTTIECSLEEDQGTILANPDGLSGTDLDDALAIMNELSKLAPAKRVGLTRQFGPLQISVNSADDAVVEAVVRAVVVETDAQNEVIEGLQGARGDGPVERAGIIQAAVRAGLSNEERLKLAAILIDRSTLWRLTADVRPSPTRSRLVGRRTGSRPSLRRFEGHVLIGGPGRRGAVGDWDRPGPFLSWVEVDLRRQAAEAATRTGARSGRDGYRR